MADPMTTIDTSPEALERLAKTASIRFGEIYLRNAETVTLADLRAIEQAMLPAIKHAIAAERHAEIADTTAFLSGAKAMQEAAVTICSHFDSKSPYIGQAKHVEIAIRAIDPAALTEKREPQVCEACEGHGCVATSEKDMEGFPIEVVCPVCNSETAFLAQRRKELGVE